MKLRHQIHEHSIYVYLVLLLVAFLGCLATVVLASQGKYEGSMMSFVFFVSLLFAIVFRYWERHNED